jgi:geranylgeranyl diphosphate synthase type I
VFEKYRSLRDDINRELEMFLTKKEKSSDPLLSEYFSDIKDHVMHGGKRLRPMCMVYGFASLQEEKERIIPPSTSCELVHSASLILDDAMDEDVVRHGKTTFNAIYADRCLRTLNFDLDAYKDGREWINKRSIMHLFNLQRIIFRYSYGISVLASNFMYAMSEETLLESDFVQEKKMHALDLHRRMYLELNEGQLTDIFFENKRCYEEEYFSMILKKTGILFVYPIRIGLLFAEAPDCTMLDGYSRPMSQSFQIRDDILGTFGETTGKPQDSDIKEGKRTLLVIKAYEGADESEKERLDAVLGDKYATKDDVNDIKEIFEDTGALEYCEEKGKSLNCEAKEFLERIGISYESKEFFCELADYVIEREM